ncbi:MAG: carbamoyltransferase HypF [Actinomycetota bacterium]|nr:carbamoyltransferase HypF [Actinomycetota bacterium]
MKALSFHITGIVQGVGFRPFVYNLAVGLDLAGWVLNSSEGVFCVVEGTEQAVGTFAEQLRSQAPPMSVIESIVAEEVEAEGFAGFEIRESQAVEGAMTLISPDIATCDACVAELLGAHDRRARYPFINCTNCGPRFTIIEDIPYDRPQTTMRDFPMCGECAGEYGDPSDRRFHAQPDACFVCGPRLYLNVAPGAGGERDLPADAAWTPETEAVPRPHRELSAERERSDAIIGEVARLLGEGRIVAIKGLGGFHLACDATSEAAVQLLRERKHRRGRPLAIMVADLAAARAICEVGPEEEGLLTGTIRPVVLLRRRDPAGGAADTPIAPAVAGDLREMGVMLPYTPLHHLLLREVGRPLVMTSGNLSEEPIATGNSEALERLGAIADAFLLHDRGIYSRYDDSVVRVVEGLVEPVRRARGYAPFPVPLPFQTDIDILACGPEQKNTFTLLTREHAFVSQHIGDMENAETLAAYEETIALYKRLFRIEPRLVAHDLHPEYLSTKFARTLDLPKIGVQHHHAHIVSVTAEHGIGSPVIGVSFDGTGYGSDGRIWGGEVLIGDWATFERFAHLSYVPMPGGAGAIRRPARMAVGTLVAHDLLDHPGAAPLRSRLADGEETLLLQMIDKSVNCPLTSSMGRLFDAVAAIAGVRDDVSYEGQAAIEFEAVADPGEEGAYLFEHVEQGEGEPWLIDPLPVLVGVLEDVANGAPPGIVSRRFHRAVVHCIVDVCQEASSRNGISDVALAGGVFMNRLVLGGAVRGLADAGLSPLTHIRLPMNDGAVSFGQAVVAWANRHEV